MRIWDARNLETVKMIAIDESDASSCDLTTRHGHLCVLVSGRLSYKLYT